MKKYCINRAELKENQEINGIAGNVMCLFSEWSWEGKGNFCGWYGVEFYNNAKIIAYCTGEKKPENVFVYEKVFEQVIIWSAIVEQTFEAENDEVAIQIFSDLIATNKLKYDY